MHRYRAPGPVDLAVYEKPESKLETKFGLPRAVRFCKRCVISNQRPNSTAEYSHTEASKKETISFDSDGVCDACRMTGKKSRDIDWALREKELKDLCARHRSKDGSYDCIVPGSGGKDSFYAAHKLKYVYGMHPLTATWAPHLYTDWGWRNFLSWIHAGFDNILSTPNGRVHRLLTRLALENLFHPFQPFIIGQKAISPKLAVLHKVPLVFYGESEAEYGNPVEGTAHTVQDWKYFTTQDKSQVFLGGTSVADLVAHFGVEPNDLIPYLPPDPDQLRKLKMEVHYLGYYLRWHPQGAYYYAVENGGFQASSERNAGTYSKYNSIDDKMDDLHYYTTFVKFGIGRATADAAQEIRNGEITREEGAALVRKFDGEFPDRWAPELFRYLSLPGKEYPAASRMFEQPEVDKAYFLALADRFRSPHLWKNERGAWRLRRTVFDGSLSRT
ncbi:MAG: N-acetyl sugar amidotransferase [Elusimicrobia bacterium]|nr:N-acetyl sugar amidotransferase [Elusimicrobiota bacterium]